LGPIYNQETELFYETPIVNIDHHAGNDHFGRVNWVELTATSTAEILVAMLESLSREKNLIDPDIATCLLTGITTDTGSFQNGNTTPKSFTVAAQLIAAGARQQEIVQNIFKTKPLSTLKLWGRVLSKIQEDTQDRFVWSSVTAQDMLQEGAEAEETSGVVDELLKTVPGVDFALLLSERKDGVHGSLRGIEKGINVADIAREFSGGGHEVAAAFYLPNTTLLQSETTIINKIKGIQNKRIQANNPNFDNLNNQNNQIQRDIEQINSNFSST
jgi:phosphoesterase RecJ-like protein